MTGPGTGDYGAADLDWSVLQVPTARAMVRGQLGFSWAELRNRLAGITDEEVLTVGLSQATEIDAVAPFRPPGAAPQP